MDMLTGEQIAEADLTDWRKLGQGLHARYVVGDFRTGVRFVAAVGEAADALGHHPRVTLGGGYVDVKLVSEDAVYRDGEGAWLSSTMTPPALTAAAIRCSATSGGTQTSMWNR